MPKTNTFKTINRLKKMSANGTTELDRVRAHTNPDVLQTIDARIEERIRFYATQPKEAITQRIEELDQEWDIERCLQTNAAALALTGLLFGLLRRKWLLLTGGVLGFLMQHAIQGWCPPIPLLRRMGVRTRGEIDREKYALKILRGDFQNIATDVEQLTGNPAGEVLHAVST